ncbi:hypothetical protein D3C72_1412170 [compost metagenome]
MAAEDSGTYGLFLVASDLLSLAEPVVRFLCNLAAAELISFAHEHIKVSVLTVMKQDLLKCFLFKLQQQLPCLFIVGVGGPVNCSFCDASTWDNHTDVFSINWVIWTSPCSEDMLDAVHGIESYVKLPVNLTTCGSKSYKGSCSVIYSGLEYILRL